MDTYRGLHKPQFRDADFPISAIASPLGQALVPYIKNEQLNHAIVDVPMHTPQEMSFLVAKVDGITKREREFPIALYEHRSNFDRVSLTLSQNYASLIELLQTQLDKTEIPVDKDMLNDILSLLKGDFDALMSLALEAEADMSTKFADYKSILCEQLAAVFNFERANLHNSLAVWKNRSQWDHQHNLSKQMTSSHDAALNKDEYITKLKQSHSATTLRLGLVLGEKKDLETKLRQCENQIEEIKSTNVAQLSNDRDRIIDLEKECRDNDRQNKLSADTISKYLKRIQALKKESQESKETIKKLRGNQVTHGAEAQLRTEQAIELGERLQEAAAEETVTQQNLTTLMKRYDALVNEHQDTEAELEKCKESEAAYAQAGRDIRNKWKEATAKVVDSEKLILILNKQCMTKTDDIDKVKYEATAKAAATQKQIKTLQEHCKDLTKKLEDTQAELDSSNIKSGESTARLAVSQKEVTTLQERCKALTKNLQNTQAELASSKLTNKEISVKLQESEQAQQRKQSKSNSEPINVLEKQVAQYKKELAAVVTGKKEDETNASILTEVTRLKGEKNELKSQLDHANRRIDELEIDLSRDPFTAVPGRYLLAKGPDAVDDKSEKVTELEELVSLLEEQNSIFQTKLDELINDPLEHRMARLQNQLQIYKELLTQDRYEPGTLQSRLSEAKEIRLRNSGLHKENIEKRYVSPDYYAFNRGQKAKEMVKKAVTTPARKKGGSFWMEESVELFFFGLGSWVLLSAFSDYAWDVVSSMVVLLIV